MLCGNCNYILSGEEAYCPHCGQEVKTQETEKSENQNNNISLNNVQEPTETKGTIFDEESIVFPPQEEKQPQKKRRGTTVTVLALLTLILVITAVFTAVQYFDLVPVVASFIASQSSGEDNSVIVTTAKGELDTSKGMVAPEINYRPVQCTVTSVKGLALRKGPDDTYAALSTVPQGTRLQITGGALSNDSWVYVYIPSRDCFGWLNAAYLMADSVAGEITTAPSQEKETQTTTADGTKSSEEKPEALSQKRTAEITAEKGLYLRTGPGVDFEAVTIIGKGEKVTVINECETDPLWIYVQFKKHKGYVNIKYISQI